MNNILFLDIDGCLNDHTFNVVAQSNTILLRCVEQLNRIIEATQCQIVIISAWRYIVLLNEMTIRGFEYMMRTHGIACENRIIGTTSFDIKDGSERAMQVERWIQNNRGKIRNYVIIDDMDFGYTQKGMNFVQPNGKIGLTVSDAGRAIVILRGA